MLGNNKKITLAFVLFLLILSFMQFIVPYIIDFDGYYHIKSAEMIRENGFIKEFPWAEHTILAKEYADIQLLFRILLMPFTFLGLELGAKIAAIVFGSVAFAVFFWFLLKNEIKYALFWTLLYLFTSESLTYRFLLSREMPLAIALLIITIHLLQTKKYKLLALTSFVFALLYAGFVFQLLVILLYSVLETIFNKKFDFKLIFYSFLGLFIALFANPYFPHNLFLLYTQIFKVNLFANLYNVEWKPWPFADFIINNALVLIYLFISIIIVIINRKITKAQSFYFILVFFFFIYTLKSRRMQEYLVPFSIMAVSLFLNQYIEKFEKNKIKYIKIIAILFIVILGSVNFVILRKEVLNNTFLYNFNNCAEWMQKNIPKNSLVFNNAYSFPYLFFKNSDLRYTHGIDLTYSYLYNPSEFERYMGILQGTIAGNTDWILKDYSPDYVFAGKIKQDIQLYNYIIKNKKNYQPVYEDKWCAVLKVKRNLS